MRSALILAVLGAAGCNVLFGFDDIHPNPDASIDAAGPAPHVFSSPGPRRHSMGYDFAKTVTATLAADDPTTMIYYTTDGTTPSMSSKHAKTPITGISIASSEMLTYFGVTADFGTSTPVADAYYIATAAQTVAGYHVTGVTLDGMSPVVVVQAGQVLTAASAHVEVWVQGSCPACAAQVVYGVDDSDQGCLFDSTRDDPSGPGVYPGFTGTMTFRVTAPTTPGVHIVRITHSEQTSCASAMAMNSLMTRPDLSRIGVLIVE